MNKYFTVAAASLVALSIPTASQADDQRLEAALRRIEALEGKMERLSSLEAENKQLKARLNRIEKVAATTPSTKLPSQSSNATQSMPATIPVATNDTVQDASQKWQGFYAGINAGYGANVNNRRNQSQGSYYFDTADTYYAGGIVGLQAGFNEVFANKVVLGIETEANYANVYDFNNSYNYSRLGTSYVYDYSQGYWNAGRYIASYNSNYSQTGLEAIGTTRFRLGYALGNFMPFITGGAAYGMVSHETKYTGINSSYTVNWTPIPYVSDSSYNASVAAGWAAGGGFEYMLADNWSTKFEYLYTSIGQIRFNNTNETYGFFGVNQARMGLNYHFDTSDKR